MVARGGGSTDPLRMASGERPLRVGGDAVDDRRGLQAGDDPPDERDEEPEGPEHPEDGDEHRDLRDLTIIAREPAEQGDRIGEDAEESGQSRLRDAILAEGRQHAREELRRGQLQGDERHGEAQPGYGDGGAGDRGQQAASRPEVVEREQADAEVEARVERAQAVGQGDGGEHATAGGSKNARRRRSRDSASRFMPRAERRQGGPPRREAAPAGSRSAGPPASRIARRRGRSPPG